MNVLSLWLSQLYWREPVWLLLGLFPVVLIILRRLIHNASLLKYAEPHLHPWVVNETPGQNREIYWNNILLIIAWTLLGIAAAGPRLLITAAEDVLPADAQAMILLDHSRSMQAEDISPNRYRLALQQLQHWINHSDGIKLGLGVFAGGSHIVVPPTSDKLTLNNYSRLLQDIRLPTHGSSIDQAVTKAINIMENTSASTRAIIILTDGDFSEDQFDNLVVLGNTLKDDNIKLYFIGIGTPSPVTLYDDNGRWLSYQGATVTTRLNEQELIKLTDNSAIHYQRLNQTQHTSILDIWQPDSERLSLTDQESVLWQELFAWFLIPGVLILLLQNLEIATSRPGLLSLIGLMPFLLLSLQSNAIQAKSESSLEAAHNAWVEQQYELAAQLYAEIDGYPARMGEGASCFRSRDIDCAIHAFSLAAWQASTDQQRGRAAYNLGNSYFRQGDFPAAIVAYRDALRYQPEQRDYKNNLLFTEEVQERIELRLQQEATSLEKRLAAGQRTREIDDNISLPPDMSVVLDDDKNSNDIEIDDEVLQQYLERYQANVSLRQQAGKAHQRLHDWHRFNNQDPVAAHELAFWQRLFELEEEILVSPETPLIIEGVRPW